MRLPLTRLAPLAAALFVVAAAPAQATLTVGPGGFAQIADAIAAASPGDLIVVQNGAYLPFHLSIGVRIVAPNGATITTPPGGGGLPWVHDIQPPAGQQAVITGLSFRNNTAFPPAEPPVALRATGNVLFADCSFVNFADFAVPSVTCDGDVQFDRCTFDGIYQCVVVQGGRVAMSHCQLRTLQTIWAPTSFACIGGSQCELSVHSSTLRAAHGMSGPGPTGAPAIQLGTATRLSMADCEVYGGNSYTGAVSAVVSSSAFPVLHARCLVQSGTPGFTGVPPVPTPAFSGLEQTAPLVGGSAPTRPAIGAASSGTVIGPSGNLCALVLSFARTPATSVPFAAQPILFDPAQAAIYDVGLLNGTTSWAGFGTFAWQTGSLPPTVFGLQFWLHPLVWDGATFQVGPSYGGIAH